jgi:hypothetical protein
MTKLGNATAETFTVDRDYLRAEALEGVRSFLAPLSHIYRAATGTSQNRQPDPRSTRGV